MYVPAQTQVKSQGYGAVENVIGTKWNVYLVEDCFEPDFKVVGRLEVVNAEAWDHFARIARRLLDTDGVSTLEEANNVDDVALGNVHRFEIAFLVEASTVGIEVDRAHDRASIWADVRRGWQPEGPGRGRGGGDILRVSGLCQRQDALVQKLDVEAAMHGLLNAKADRNQPVANTTVCVSVLLCPPP